MSDQDIPGEHHAPKAPIIHSDRMRLLNQGSIEEAKRRAFEIASKITSKLQADAAPTHGKRPREEEGDGYSQWPVSDGLGHDKKRKKIAVPVHQHPDVNFFGLLIGPRGQTQRELEMKTGAKIFVRGKGSSQDADGEEDMHVLVVGDNDDQINRASDMLEEILQNPEKIQALREEQAKKLAEVTESTPPAESSFNGSSTPPQQSGYFSPSEEQRVHYDIRIPNDKVGMIIGRKGENIQALQAQTGARIQIAKECEPGTNDRVVTVTGSAQEVDRAKAELSRMVEMRNAERNYRPGLGSTPGSTSISTSSSSGGGVVMQIPQKIVGLLIGKSGETIRGIQTRTGAMLQVTRDAEADPNQETRPVSISGTPQQVEAAQSEIRNLIQSQGPPGTAPTVVSAKPGGLAVVKIPLGAVGCVIGRSGETIRQLQTKTGARIQIAREGQGPDRDVTITGEPHQVDMAKREIFDLVVQSPAGRTGATAREVPQPGQPAPSPYGAPSAAPAASPYGRPFDPYAAGQGHYPPHAGAAPQPYGYQHAGHMQTPDYGHYYQDYYAHYHPGMYPPAAGGYPGYPPAHAGYPPHMGAHPGAHPGGAHAAAQTASSSASTATSTAPSSASSAPATPGLPEGMDPAAYAKYCADYYQQQGYPEQAQAYYQYYQQYMQYQQMQQGQAGQPSQPAAPQQSATTQPSAPSQAPDASAASSSTASSSASSDSAPSEASGETTKE